MENSPVRISIFRTLDLNPVLLRGTLLEYFLGNIVVRINSQLLESRFSRRGQRYLGGHTCQEMCQERTGLSRASCASLVVLSFRQGPLPARGARS